MKNLLNIFAGFNAEERKQCIETLKKLDKAITKREQADLEVNAIFEQYGTKQSTPVMPTVEITEDIKKEEKPVKKEVKPNHKVSDVSKLINCGPSQGDNAVLFIEKRRDNKHLWYGQIRISGYIRNFHWSNELDMPIVYGVEGAKDLKECRTLIRSAVYKINPKELLLYDEAPDHPDFGGFHGRQFLQALSQGAYIYLDTKAQLKEEEQKDDDIVAQGYTDDHAFIVRRDREVYWRHYNYVFMKKPFEKSPSKGYDKEQLKANVQLLFDSVYDQFEKYALPYYRKDAKKEQKKENNPTKHEYSDLSTDGLF